VRKIDAIGVAQFIFYWPNKSLITILPNFVSLDERIVVRVNPNYETTLEYRHDPAI
jgi:hypothetical protein